MKETLKKRLLFMLISLLAFSSGIFAQYPTVSIHDLQFVADPVNDDQSAFFGDTVVVEGLVMNGPRDLWVGSRWAIFIIDPNNYPNPWSGFFIIQHDTFETATNFGFLEPGMICQFTGVIDEFGQFSQLAVLTDPVTAINILSVGNPLPAPLKLTTADLDGPAAGEQWESMFVKVDTVTIINNSVSGNWASFNDASGSAGYGAEYFNFLRDLLNAGSWFWPNAGSQWNISGFVRDESGSPGRVYNINPPDTTSTYFVPVGDPPPLIATVARDIGVPTSGTNVEVTATITDNGSVQSADVHYSVDGGPFLQAAMTDVGGGLYSAMIPAQNDGAFVRYFVSATDNLNGFSKIPADTSRATGQIFFYDVRNGGLSIADVQNTHGYASDASGYVGFGVTLTGVVMTDSTDRIGDYWIQEDAATWSGIWVNDGTFTHTIGDEVEVTGLVEESFGVTRLNGVTSSNVVNAGVGAFAPVSVTTGEIGSGVNGEAYESVLITTSNLTVTDPFPDGFPGFGEFVINDGSGDMRVDDLFSAYNGQVSADTTHPLGSTIAAVTGFGYFSFGNYKIVPRDSMDVDIVGSIKDNENGLVQDFALEQNYPNPFNPTTEIRYTIAKSGVYSLAVYNVLGQQVRVLNVGQHTVGNHQVNWNGLDASGNRVGSGIYFYRLSGQDVNLSKKMILLK